MAPADRGSMRLAPCLFAPLLLLLPGCFDSYGLGDPDTGTRRPDGGLGDYVCHCCGVDVLVASEDECLRGTCDPYCLFPADAGTDAALDPSCGGRPVDLTCLDHVPAGRVADGHAGGATRVALHHLAQLAQALPQVEGLPHQGTLARIGQ